jgi:predicted transcriptional regulator
MQVQVSHDVQQLIDQFMASRGYANANDLLRDALHSLAEQQDVLAAIEEGISDMETGRFRAAEEVMAEVRARLNLSSDP